LVFVPMFDAAHTLGRKFWKKLKNVKVVCFSAALKAQCAKFGLDLFHLQYYPEDATSADIGYESKNLFFWQRRIWPNWSTVASALPTTQFKRMHIHVALDPDIKSDVYPTKSELKVGNITLSSWFEKKSDLVEKQREFNIFFVPRDLEGIGFSFLDAMSIGLVPVGFNTPTYNEYVVDGLNGFIIIGDQRFDLPELSPISSNLVHYMKKGRKNYDRKLKLLRSFLFKSVSSPNYMIPSSLRYVLHKRVRTRIITKRDRYTGTTPLITVVTVVRNDVVGLSRTFQSVFEQTCNDFEYIVMDGNSSDKTMNLVRTHDSSIDNYVSEVDDGPYDAMLKAAALARGRYIIFMNAGDEFAEVTSLEDSMESVPDGVDIIYGHHYYIQKKRTKVHLARNLNLTFAELKAGKLSFPWLTGIPCHQATLIRRELLLSLRFNPDFRIAADHAFLFKACAQGCSSYHTNTFIAKYQSGGLSSRTMSQCHAEWEKIALDHSEDSVAVRSFYKTMR
jgi:Glycosyl transferase family 2/Glycosyl transferases group 1